MRRLLHPLLLAALAAAQDPAAFRPRAVPLIAHDPYFSVWSMADTLTDQPTRHWTGSPQPLLGLARIDGAVFRFLGVTPGRLDPIPPMRQTAFRLTPTRSIYEFEAAGVHLELTFLTPTLPDSLDILARPVTYLVWRLRSLDSRPHSVRLYLDAENTLAVNIPEQRAVWSRLDLANLKAIRLSSLEQNILAKSGDNLRIDWGHFYLAAPAQGAAVHTLGLPARHRALYLKTLDLPESRDAELPLPSSRDIAVVALALDLPSVGPDPVTRFALLAYDDLYSIEYLRQWLRPYWRRERRGIDELLAGAARDFSALSERARRFDDELTADLTRVGGPRYAALATAAYRQAFAAHKLAVDSAHRPLHFSKENFSNGCIATVDVTYPGSPLFLLLKPALLKAQLRPILEYARSSRWRFPFAPHDLGQYPLANGQVYGGGEESEDRQMPVEETGNVLLLMAALAHIENDAAFSREFWPLLSSWAAYLRDKGLDPENQLNTDDFAGHSARNANLSLKAILALAAYSRLAARLGHADIAAAYDQSSRAMAAQWLTLAADGDHYRLTFDQPGSWSQKYNLVWDKLLGLGLFPPDVARREIAYYKTRLKPFGLPLDSRADYTKLDWTVWTATLAGDRADFETLIEGPYRFAAGSPTRVPLSDWYFTTDGRQRGFQARSVVGGVFIKMLEDGALWRKWAERAR